MNKTILISVFVGLIIVASFLLYHSSTGSLTTNQSSPQPTDIAPIQAGINAAAAFAIFTNGTVRIFSDSRYHNLSPDIYLQADNPNIIHLQRSGLTWNDFFKTLPMKLSPECLTTGTGQNFCTNNASSLKFYLNGQPDPKALEQTINQNDQLLVSYGNENDLEITKQLEQIPSLK